MSHFLAHEYFEADGSGTTGGGSVAVTLPDVSDLGFAELSKTMSLSLAGVHGARGFD